MATKTKKAYYDDPLKFYQEPNGDYLAIAPDTLSYYQKNFNKNQYEGRITAIAGNIGSVQTSGISTGFLNSCKEVPRERVPAEWLRAIEGNANTYSQASELDADQYDSEFGEKQKTGAGLMHSDNDLGLKLEPAAGGAHIDGPEAGPSNDELHASGHAENGANGSPVLDGSMKSPERQNVNAIREALEAQVEMEVGKPIEQKQEEMARAEKAKDEKAMHPSIVTDAKEVSAKPGTQIIINVASADAKDAKKTAASDA